MGELRSCTYAVEKGIVALEPGNYIISSINCIYQYGNSTDKKHGRSATNNIKSQNSYWMQRSKRHTYERIYISQLYGGETTNNGTQIIISNVIYALALCATLGICTDEWKQMGLTHKCGPRVLFAPKNRRTQPKHKSMRVHVEVGSQSKNANSGKSKDDV